MFELFKSMTFLWPFAFALLPLPFVVWFFSRTNKSQAVEEDALVVPFFSALSGENALLPSQPSKQTGLKMVVLWLVFALLVTALARPTQLGKPEPLPTKGRDVMLAIDLSDSMSANDLAGGRLTRLDVVKAAASEFIARRKGDRMGLVFFSDRAYLQSPLTFDRQAVQSLLSEATVGLTGNGTAIGDAIAIGVKRLEESTHASADANTKAKKDAIDDSRVMILLTDGSDNSGTMTPLAAADIAKSLGIRIYTIGVGSNMTDAWGRPIAEMDEDTLKAIAQETGGDYFRATDAQTLDNVYREIDKLVPKSTDPQYIRPEKPLYQYPLLLALIIAGLALSLVLGHRYREQRALAAVK
ncbi:vWA domain-containing protein [Suttonella ornithocola]|uniref:VWFA-related Acidobacterial domain n=1 Tax=Suttonella ornithocola TaxID=279832 RepID=A0A380MWN3_9GAMM|nr:VWA domain-containing protein [Suttonella ornithocola]SUO96985.1 VWFA-related Acidobacterial domain [Suttonella ornithocola]